jgi:hypothetical protein
MRGRCCLPNSCSCERGVAYVQGFHGDRCAGTFLYFCSHHSRSMCIRRLTVERRCSHRTAVILTGLSERGWDSFERGLPRLLRTSHYRQWGEQCDFCVLL